MNKEKNPNRQFAWPKITLEPYRLFFPLGWLTGLIGIGYWLFVSLGISKTYDPAFHALFQIELFAGAFAVGFLLTALPKFMRTKSASNKEIILILTCFVALTACLFSGSVAYSQVCFIAILLQVMRFAVVRFKERSTTPPESFLLVGFGLFQGILGALFILLPCELFPLIGQKFLFQGMFLSLSLGIGSFLGPRLMGTVDVTNAIINMPGLNQAKQSWYLRPHVAVFLCGLIIFFSFLIETGLDFNLGMSLRAVAATAFLYMFGVLKVPRNCTIVGFLVAISLWLMILGLWIAAIVPEHAIGAMHITYIGGFGMLILSISAQVISSHGGVSNFWVIRRSWAICTAALVLLAMALRASATTLPQYYFLLLGVSAFCFVSALILWSIGLFSYLGQKAGSP